MRGVQLEALLAPPSGQLGDALDVVVGFDEALTLGFGRPGAQQGAALAALAALAGAVAGTALGPAVAEAAEKAATGSVAGEQLAALAGARTAVFGAVHDALLTQLDTALGRGRSEPGAPAPAEPEPPAEMLLGGCRAWLQELAVAGWRGVDHDMVTASDQVVEALLAQPGQALRGLAVLVDGLAAELRASAPVATMAEIPARRWGDLWARALLLARAGGRPSGAELVSGRLLVLGVDVHEHGTAVQVQVHGVLESGGTARLVRAGIGAAKVDTIVGPTLWRLLAGFPVLLAALAKRRSITLTDMALLPSGDLIWQEERATVGEPADPFATARIQLPVAQRPEVPPLHRHPVRIAEPVLLDGYTVTAEGAFALDGQEIPVDLQRLPTCGPLTPELVRASQSCIGLLRWDGRWTLQPIAVRATVKRKPVEAHTGDWAQGPTDPKVVKAEARAGDAVAVLRERAGRLLRR